jgi:hypothetical protein
LETNQKTSLLRRTREACFYEVRVTFDVLGFVNQYESRMVAALVARWEWVPDDARHFMNVVVNIVMCHLVNA